MILRLKKPKVPKFDLSGSEHSDEDYESGVFDLQNDCRGRDHSEIVAIQTAKES